MTELSQHIGQQGLMLTGRGGRVTVNPAVKEHLKMAKGYAQMVQQLDMRVW
jgi:hypothetical protein